MPRSKSQKVCLKPNGLKKGQYYFITTRYRKGFCPWRRLFVLLLHLVCLFGAAGGMLWFFSFFSGRKINGFGSFDTINDAFTMYL